MSGNLFCILNYCNPIYAITFPVEAHSDQTTGEYVDSVYVIRRVYGNVATGTNIDRQINIREGETLTGNKTFYTYTRLPIPCYLYIDGEMFEILSEDDFTPFMYRMVGEMRYSYSLNKTTSLSPDAVQAFLDTGVSSPGFKFDLGPDLM